MTSTRSSVPIMIKKKKLNKSINAHAKSFLKNQMLQGIRLTSMTSMLLLQTRSLPMLFLCMKIPLHRLLVFKKIGIIRRTYWKRKSWTILGLVSVPLYFQPKRKNYIFLHLTRYLNGTFNFPIVNFPFICSNMTAAAAFEVFI